MKFLCVRCDEPMKLARTAPPDRGSVAVIYACPGCSNEIAMLTNPYETQLVSSLGVRIGPERSAGEAAGSGTSSCPFSGMVQEMSGAGARPAGEIPWTPRARSRLDNIPEFIRPMARAGIEKFAADHGFERVDEAVLDRAKDFFGM